MRPRLDSPHTRVPSADLTYGQASHKVTHYASFHEASRIQGVKQLTIRGLGDELTRAIRRLANRDDTSLNRAAVKLLRRGAGLADGQER